MPTARKLSVDEVQTLETKSTKGDGQRSAVAAEYDGYLAEFAPGDYGEAALSEGESKLNVRNRLRSAAQRRGWTLEFIRTRDSAVRFRVVSENGDEATEVFGMAQEEMAAAA